VLKIYEEFDKRIVGCGFCNSTIKYYATDDPKLWRPTDEKDIIHERKKTYTYKFNSEGFRCDEFSESSEFPIVFLGCSQTCGVGLELENTWAYILLNAIKNHTGKTIPLWSLATAGSSIDKQALLLEKYSSEFNPKMIFFLIPSIYRRLILLNNELVEYLPAHRTHWRPNDVTIKVAKFDRAFMEEDYAIFETYKNLLLINQLAKMYNCKVYCATWGFEDENQIKKILCNQLSQFEYLNIPFFPDILARDASHAGPGTHRHLAGNIFEKIKDQL
jgi:hypothetical protein